MKNDKGIEWTRQEYIVASITFVLMVIIIIIPVGIFLLFNWIIGWKYHWYAWGVLFTTIFFIALFSKQIANKINLYDGMNTEV